MIKTYFYILSSVYTFVLCSCSTILNSKKSISTVITSERANLVVGKDTQRAPDYTFVMNKDTQKVMGSKYVLAVKRNNKPVSITLYTDSTSRTVSVKPRLSATYFLNAYPVCWPGFIIDAITKKMFQYPNIIYIDMRDTGNTYLTYKPIVSPNLLYANSIKVTPLKLIGLQHPAFELAYERRTSKAFSSQLMVSYLLPVIPFNIGDSFKPEMKGFRIAFEEKFYLRRSAIFGPYVGIEVDYLNKQYRDIEYFHTDSLHSVTQHTPDSIYAGDEYLDTISIKKQTISFNVKLGIQYIHKRLAVDAYVGFGFRYKDIIHTDKIYADSKMVSMSRHYSNLELQKNENGSRWVMCFPLNVRIGWVF